MPVLVVRCPDCEHTYRSLVMEGARVPRVWHCSSCGGRNAQPVDTDVDDNHPFSGGQGCACCG